MVAAVVSPHLPTSKNIDTLSLDREIKEIRLLEAPKSSFPPSPLPLIPEVLNRIAYCESRNRQYDEKGNVIRGINPYDVGRYQINLTHWGEEAKKLEFDLHTEEGNEAMALYIYRKFGTRPWYWSQKCWDR